MHNGGLIDLVILQERTKTYISVLCCVNTKPTKNITFVIYMHDTLPNKSYAHHRTKHAYHINYINGACIASNFHQNKI